MFLEFELIKLINNHIKIISFTKYYLLEIYVTFLYMYLESNGNDDKFEKSKFAGKLMEFKII